MSGDLEEALLERLFGDRERERRDILSMARAALSMGAFMTPLPARRPPPRGAHLPAPGTPKRKRPYKGSKAAKKASRRRQS